jgi:transcriptional regulator with XRE-family HTH domain
MDLAGLLKQKRAQLRLNQTEAARRVGLSRSHYARIEGGNPKRPEWETLQKIAEGFGMNVAVLVEATGQTIMEAAGYVNDDLETDELLQLFDRLGDDDKDRLVAIARALYQLARE